MIQYPFRVGQTVTRVLEAGDRRSVPIVLLHGVGARADRWRRNISALAVAGSHVYAIDLPGHGFACRTADFDYSIAGFRTFVTQFLDSVRADRTVLIGTSLGAHIHADLACTDPGRVAALIMVGPLGLGPLGASRREEIRRSLADTSREGIRRKLLRVIHDPAHVTEAWVTEEYLVNNAPGAPESWTRIGAYVADEIDNDIVGPKLAHLNPRPPVLLIWGAEDAVVPAAMAEQALELMDLDARSLVTIPATGHLPYHEAPERFNEVVLDFLRAHDVLHSHMPVQGHPSERT